MNGFVIILLVTLLMVAVLGAHRIWTRSPHPPLSSHPPLPPPERLAPLYLSPAPPWGPAKRHLRCVRCGATVWEATREDEAPPAPNEARRLHGCVVPSSYSVPLWALPMPEAMMPGHRNRDGTVTHTVTLRRSALVGEQRIEVDAALSDDGALRVERCHVSHEVQPPPWIPNPPGNRHFDFTTTTLSEPEHAEVLREIRRRVENYADADYLERDRAILRAGAR
jgi:hypothetical protein